MNSIIRLPAPKGRGSASRFPHRFETEARTPFDDGWPDDAAPLAVDGPATEVYFEDVHSALSHNDSPDLNFEAGLNPYRGCEHGCSYCYARPTHSYLGLSPGLDFEARIIAKRNLRSVLAQELGSPRHRPTPIAIGSATDAYQPVKRSLRITRGVLELLHQCHHPFGVVTKGSGVERDLDLLVPMAERRLRTLRTLAAAGVPVAVSVGPQIPFINVDMEQVLAAAHEAGARRAFYTVIRLPWEVSPLFRAWLEQHYPDRAARVMARIQQMRGGRDYRADFATRMRGDGPWADLIRQRFEVSCQKLGLNAQRIALDTSQFRHALAVGQGSLF